MKTVKVGLLHSRSGTMAVSEEPLLAAEFLAIEEINTMGGILGRHIEYIVEDGASSPEIFAQKAEKLICQDHVFILFGTWNSHVRKAVKSVVEKHNALLWYPIQYEGLEESENIFYTGSCLNQQVFPILDWCCKNGWKKYYLLGSDYVYPIVCNDLLKRAILHRGGKIVEERYKPLGHSDFRRIISSFRKTCPDVIINTLNGDSNIHFFQQFHRAGLTAEDFPVISTSIAEHEFQKIGKGGKGHYTCWNYFQELENPENHAFLEKFTKRYGENCAVSDPIAMAYSQIYMWKQIVESANSFDIEDIREKAMGQVFLTPAGSLEMMKNHHLRKKSYIGKAMENGNFSVVADTGKFIDPLPWLSVDSLNYPLSYLTKDILKDFPEAVHLNFDLSLKAENFRSEILKYKELFDCCPDGMLIASSEGDIMEANQAYLDILGYSWEEIESKNFMQFIKQWKREESDLLKRTKNGALYFEKECLCKNGTKIPVSFTGWYSEKKGREPIIAAVIKDLSASKKSKAEIQKFKTIFDQVNYGNAITDLEGNIEYINPYFAKIHGYTTEELIGKNISIFHNEEQMPEVTETIEKLKKYGSFTQEIWHSHRDGSTFLMLMNGILLKDEEGKPEFLATTAIDITERKQLERKLRQAEKMEAIGHLAGGIAHDFNNILTGIIGYADISLCEIPSGSELQENLEQILKAADRAKNLVAQILTFSRKSMEKKAPVYIRPIVREAVQLLRASLPTTIEIKTNLQRDTSTVLADSNQIHEIVMNLCTNSAHAMKDEKGVLEISCIEMRVDSKFMGMMGEINPGQYSVIMIKDDGCGMSKEVLSHAFEAFYTTKEIGRGTGMGLAVVNAIIQSHKGNLIVHTAPNDGTTFRIFFPKTGRKKLDKSKEIEIQGGTEKILFVDDEEFIVCMNEASLGALGYHVTSFTDSWKALRAFQKDPMAFDLVITDQTMPNLTGLELAEEILDTRKDIPIILCTGYSRLVNREMAIAVGIKDFVMKPIRRHDIAFRIRKVLDGG